MLESFLEPTTEHVVLILDSVYSCVQHDDLAVCWSGLCNSLQSVPVLKTGW